MADILYTAAKKGLGDGTFDLDSDTLKVALLTSAHSPSAAHTVLADVSAAEASGTGYTAGGQTLTGVTWAVDGTTVVLDATNPEWTDVTVAAVRYALIYAAKTVNSKTNPLLLLLDLGADKGVTAGTFTINLNAAGTLVLS
ncbi:hypothetical protein [Solidesulfovibrio sp.]